MTTQHTQSTEELEEFLDYCLERVAYMQGERVAGDWREQTKKPIRAKLNKLIRKEAYRLAKERQWIAEYLKNPVQHSESCSIRDLKLKPRGCDCGADYQNAYRAQAEQAINNQQSKGA